MMRGKISLIALLAAGLLAVGVAPEADASKKPKPWGKKACPKGKVRDGDGRCVKRKAKVKRKKVTRAPKLPPGAKRMSCSLVKRKRADPVWKAVYNKGCKHYYFGRSMFVKWAGAEGAAKAGYKKRSLRSLKKFMRSGYGSGADKSNARGLIARMGG